MIFLVASFTDFTAGPNKFSEANPTHFPTNIHKIMNITNVSQVIKQKY